MKKRQLGPCITFFPQPTTLVVTLGPEGPNLMTASWAGIVSKTPPTMGVSLHHNRQTYHNIKTSGAFTVNVVPSSLAVEADFCGLYSGRQEDKMAATGLTLTPGLQGEVPLIAECPLNLECRMSAEVELGDYRLVLGEIMEVHAVEAAFSQGGRIDGAGFDPLVYLGGIKEYWSLGEKVADAYRAGTALKR